MTIKNSFYFLVSFLIVLFNFDNAIAKSLSDKKNDSKPQKLRTAIVGTGCFWCSQADIEKIKGVHSALPGYSGGTLKNPTYKNHQGHIEVVKITYNPVDISFLKLVKKIWFQHIPTDSTGSFCDRGHSYRNIFFYKNPNEEKVLRKTKLTLEKILKTKIKTLIEKRTFFTLAEKYHIHYAKKNPFRYKYYRWNCRRDQALKKFWDKEEIRKKLKGW